MNPNLIIFIAIAIILIVAGFLETKKVVKSTSSKQFESVNNLTTLLRRANEKLIIKEYKSAVAISSQQRLPQGTLRIIEYL